MGLQVVMLRLFAYIPAPIIFGSTIDTTCLVWKPTECQTEGTTCLLYDIEQFRVRYGLVAIAYKVRKTQKIPILENFQNFKI